MPAVSDIIAESTHTRINILRTFFFGSSSETDHCVPAVSDIIAESTHTRINILRAFFFGSSSETDHCVPVVSQRLHFIGENR